MMMCSRFPPLTRFSPVGGTFLALGCAATLARQPEAPFADRAWIPFEWVSQTSGDRILEHAAMRVPVRIDGLDHQFTAQFDLGATRTMVYGNSFQPYLDRYADQLRLTDTTEYVVWLEGRKRASFSNTRIRLGNVPVVVPRLALLDQYGPRYTADSLRTPTVKPIGTVGADIFAGKVLIIDYPNKRLRFTDSLGMAEDAKFDWVPARLEGGRIKIPLSFGGEEQWLMFDTGASLFPVSTSPRYYQRYADTTAARDSIQTTTWGRRYWVYGSPLAVDVTLGSAVLTRRYIYNFPDFAEFFDRERMMGITGNAYFLNNVIAIDFARSRFGLKR